MKKEQGNGTGKGENTSKVENTPNNLVDSSPIKAAKSGKTTKGFDTEYFTAPNTGKKIKAAVDGNAAVPVDKVNTYARGKVADVGDELKSLQKLKQTNRKAFDADLKNEKLLDSLKQRNHNFQRSKAMKDNLEKAGLTENLRFARHHRDLVRRFGRFPHRNQILNRESTEAELEYLTSDEAFHG